MPDDDVRHGLIRLRVRDISQLFNSLDPDPFIERDLDDDAVQFIVSWAREIPHTLPVRMIVTVTEPRFTGDHLQTLQAAVANYFGQMEQLARNEFRQLMKRGRASLAIGLSILAAAVALSHLIAQFTSNPFATLLEQTVIIGGWVAMWRPMEIFLYDWWPLRRKRRDYARLRDMSVEVKLPEESVRGG